MTDYFMEPKQSPHQYRASTVLNERLPNYPTTPRTKPGVVVI